MRKERRELLVRRRLFEPLFLLRDHLCPVSAVLYTPDDYLITGDTFGVLKCHRLNGRVQWERTFEDGILSVASVAGRRHYLWVHTRSGIVHVIPSEGDEHATVGTVEKVHCGKFTFCRMHHLQYHGNNQHPRNLVALPSQITSDAIDVWDADQCIVLVSAIQPTTIPTSSASSSPSSTVAITRGNDQCGIVMCVRLIVSAIKGDDGGVNNDLVLLTGTDDGVLRAYRLNLEAGTYQQILRLKIFPQTITCLDYNHETQSVALGGPRSDLVLLKGVFDDEQRLVMRTCVANEGFSELCFSSSGRLLVTGGWDGKIRFFAADCMALLGLSNAHSDTILHVTSVHSQGGIPDRRTRSLAHHHLIISSSQDRTASVWSLDPIESCLGEH